jgi:hypothetical protein
VCTDADTQWQRGTQVTASIVIQVNIDGYMAPANVAACTAGPTTGI